MVHVPNAANVFHENGSLSCSEEEVDRWETYFDRCFSQLEWWGEAARIQRGEIDPFEDSPAFNNNPSQRNAPSKEKK
eukprot:CAMPEP_0183291568 /NCGR_PEP_ID=MMETSP0160_2-20130417/939_1 /TAXON_ID=2839 ORGANISM="Odontella Sinensis, Strain Grunow 1884" /NCGR_SAMPLE_ID=MMETSP0160_2 /ASSEMBLY_ACC=CAM_ASM_000250 /LENGTH=76 /DNA_ID=CAMNT_0025452393 /DNA_START=588 /DNA_END=818 /DNA_ORIENTATION=+